MALTRRAGALAGDALAAGATTAVVVLLGAPLGLLWARLAPVVSPGGAGVDLETLFIGSREGAFVLLSLAVGAVAGAVAWTVGRRYGPGVVLGLLAGGLLAAATAARVGTDVSLQAARAAGTGTVRAPVELDPPVAVVALPLAALVVYAALVLVLERPAPPSWATAAPGPGAARGPRPGS